MELVVLEVRMEVRKPMALYLDLPAMVPLAAGAEAAMAAVAPRMEAMEETETVPRRKRERETAAEVAADTI